MFLHINSNPPDILRKAFLILLMPLMVFLAGCSSNPCPATECDCAAEVCDLCIDAIAAVDENICNTYLFEASGYQKLIDGFHTVTHQTGSADKVAERMNVYLDFSDGMNYKVNQAETEAGLLTDLVNILSAEKVDYFRLRAEKGNEIEQLAESIGGNIQSFVRNVNNYNSSHNFAPLDVAVETIVKTNDRQSIFITDGELAIENRPGGSVDPSFAWALGAFRQWLGEGNRIDFVVMPVKEERLFFIFFTPRLLAGQDYSMVEAFLEATTDAKKRDRYHHLKFTLDDYQLEMADTGRPVNQTGLNTTFVDWVVDYSLGFNLDKGYEHIHIEDAENFKNYLIDFERGMYDEDFDPNLKERNKLFYDLLFTNEFVNYQVADLEVKAEDITQPVNAYLNYLRCQDATSVSFEDEEGATQTYWCNPWARLRGTNRVCIGWLAAKREGFTGSI